MHWYASAICGESCREDDGESCSEVDGEGCGGESCRAISNSAAGLEEDSTSVYVDGALAAVEEAAPRVTGGGGLAEKAGAALAVAEAAAAPLLWF